MLIHAKEAKKLELSSVPGLLAFFFREELQDKENVKRCQDQHMQQP